LRREPTPLLKALQLGSAGVFEAYVDKKNRVTFHYEQGAIVLRKHCNHDILKNP
jgi:hypothetical protein